MAPPGGPSRTRMASGVEDVDHAPVPSAAAAQVYVWVPMATRKTDWIRKPSPGVGDPSGSGNCTGGAGGWNVGRPVGRPGSVGRGLRGGVGCDEKRPDEFVSVVGATAAEAASAPSATRPTVETITTAVNR